MDDADAENVGTTRPSEPTYMSSLENRDREPRDLDDQIRDQVARTSAILHAALDCIITWGISHNACISTTRP